MSSVLGTEHTDTDAKTPPRAFLDIFRQLVRRTRQAARLEPQTAGDYYALLAHLPLEVLAASATALARTSVFLPSVAEWLEAADALTPPAPVPCACARCHDRGLLRVDYVDTGEPFDIAMCDCARGQWFRDGGDAAVRRYLPQLTPENRVGTLEQFTDEGRR